MTRNILCLSRSYMTHLMPALARHDPDARYFHIVQHSREEALVRATGQEVVLNMSRVVSEAFARGGLEWYEPDDMREITGFPWSSIYADRYLPEYPEAQRRRIAGALTTALDKLFADTRFDAFLSEPVALFITNYLFYLCRRYGTRPLLWANSYFPNYFYFADAMEISEPVRSSPMPEAEAAVMRESVEAFVRGVMEDRAGPAYHHAFAKPLSMLSYFKQRKGTEPLVIKPGLTMRGIQEVRLARVRLARARFPSNGDFMTAGAVYEHKFYQRALATPLSYYDEMPSEVSADSVMYPLQYEPEASLLYFAPDFQNQPAFVETLLRSLPDRAILWVKEHPNQFGALGTPVWRRLRRQYPNLRYVYGRQSGRTLIRRCGLVATISSSAGMDALLLGRRVLVAGKVYYRNYAGTLPISSPNEIAAILNDPSNYQPIDVSEACIASLQAFGASCYIGDPQPAHDLFTDANLGAISSAIQIESRRPIRQP